MLRCRPHPGEQIGPYLIRERLGEGGFANVYLADQLRPIRRRVALKLLKPGMDSVQILARFEAERQALAMMEHPHIARIYDAGITEFGHPYFVMEYVPGTSIVKYCARNCLSTRLRLSLFLEACSAVQHAHQKAIIHRDLKPSNILVAAHGGQPTVKVIDFGMAKTLGPRLSERTVYTECGQMLGTPDYMSPEQAEMSSLAADARTDVYSLGVVLYELLTGCLPLDTAPFRSAAPSDIRRFIREEQPPTPSTRLSDRKHSTASSARAKSRALVSELKGDLDWITMKAIEKDRTRRYASVLALSTDVERHLTQRPVDAARPSRIYLLSRLLRRYRAPLTAISLVVFAFCAGQAVTATGWATATALLATGSLMLGVVAVRSLSLAKEIECSHAEAGRLRCELARLRSQVTPGAMIRSIVAVGGVFLFSTLMDNFPQAGAPQSTFGVVDAGAPACVGTRFSVNLGSTISALPSSFTMYRAEVLHTNAPVFAAADVSDHPVTLLEVGTQVRVLQESRGWARIVVDSAMQQPLSVFSVSPHNDRIALSAWRWERQFADGGRIVLQRRPDEPDRWSSSAWGRVCP